MSVYKFDPSREELHRLYHERDLSINRIALEHGVSSSTVRAAIVRHGIPLKKNAGFRVALPGSRVLPPLEKELLQRMYVRQGRSVANVAEALGVGTDRVKKSLAHHGIPRHSAHRSSNKTYLPADSVIARYTERRWSVERISAYYGVHHKRVTDLLRENGVQVRGRSSSSDLPKRPVDRLEQVRVGTTLDGKPKTAVTAILSCGHKHPVHRKTTMQTDLTGVSFRCRACRNLEEKSHD